MLFKKSVFIFLTNLYILASSQVGGKCVKYSQRNNVEFCEVTEVSHKADNNSAKTSNMLGRDMQTSTLSHLFSTTDDNRTCSSELDMENGLINSAIEKLLELRGLNLKALSQASTNMSNKRRGSNETTDRGDWNIFNKIIKKRFAAKFKQMLPRGKISQKQKRLKHPPKANHTYMF